MMEAIALTVYGLSVVLNLNRRGYLLVALAFFLIEAIHWAIDFEFAAFHYLAIAGMTLIPYILCNLVSPRNRRGLQLSCVALVTIYFGAWVAWELENVMWPFAGAHMAILFIQGVLLNARGNLLAYLTKHLSGFRRVYNRAN